MPTILEVTIEATHLEAEARSKAARIVAAGQGPGASDEALLDSETAGVLIKLAEKRAGLIDRDVAEAQMRALAELEALVEEIEHSGGDTGMAHARLDVAQEGMQRLLVENRRAAWATALADLAPMNPGPGP